MRYLKSAFDPVKVLTTHPGDEQARANGVSVRPCITEVIETESCEEQIRYRFAKKGEIPNSFAVYVDFTTKLEQKSVCVADFFDPKAAQSLAKIISSDGALPMGISPLMNMSEHQSRQDSIRTLLSSGFEGVAVAQGIELEPGYHEIYEADSMKQGVKSVICGPDESPEFFSVFIKADGHYIDCVADMPNPESARALATLMSREGRIPVISDNLTVCPEETSLRRTKPKTTAKAPSM
ncbi:hypothetical protein CL689_06635 [Candidatus Saccharibacteria bacterium]|nr:hypothetical protein [Candidatus Saccharibacteria bacterium]|tara:strand:- start:848 stop:1558 length:711 start_codon:yes stop_codon:yes gene_type:complete